MYCQSVVCPPRRAGKRRQATPGPGGHGHALENCTADTMRGARASGHARLAHARGERLASGGSNRLMSVEEVAAYLGVPKSTVYDRWKPWGLKGQKFGRNLRFRRRDVETWLDKHTV
ncbi:helix-turn-helix domain-containing protein [Nonomuraea roseoviolacea]|nr:helix-turn-helix domain-containing protein [Nonomuraea roseoviolacea]